MAPKVKVPNAVGTSRFSRYKPTNKWLAASVTGASTIALSAVDNGWDKTETKMAILLVSAQLSAYLVPNTRRR